MEGFAIMPKTDCKHVGKAEHFQSLRQKIQVADSACEICQDKTENWLCMHCHKVFCSRYVNGHFLEHNQNNSAHCIGISFSDLSVWCFGCDSYIKSGLCEESLLNVAKSKFGEQYEIRELEKEENEEEETKGRKPSPTEKCKTPDCNNFGNKINEGLCNKCKFGLKDFGPKYENIPQFPPPKIYREAELESDPSATKMGKRTGALKKEELTEYLDEPEVLKQKAALVAQLLKESQHACVYTGAGVSTSAQIPDYRGPKGVWTLGALGKHVEESKPLTLALPTPCHHAIVKLHKDGVVKATISTNVDGLHKRSGIPNDELFELHGNIYLEICNTCKKEYFRKFNVTGHGNGHLTGRKCEEPNCKGKLEDSIIHFGENLPTKILFSAVDHAKISDFALVLGTSMRVAPANSLPEYVWSNGKTGKLVICNLQKTPYDKHCFVRVFAKTDDFMRLVMQNLCGSDFDLDAFANRQNEELEKY